MFQRILKLGPFAVLFSYNIVVSVKRFVLISLLRQRCRKKIRKQLKLKIFQGVVMKSKKTTSENFLAHCVNSGLLTAERIKKKYTRCLSASWTMPNEIRVITKRVI